MIPRGHPPLRGSRSKRGGSGGGTSTENEPLGSARKPCNFGVQLVEVEELVLELVLELEAAVAARPAAAAVAAAIAVIRCAMCRSRPLAPPKFGIYSLRWP